MQAQALALLEQQSFDVVLLDIHMPGTDGLALAHQLTGRADAPAVVFVTAHAGHALRAFDLEAVDYVTKPVRLSRLVLALQKVERRLAASRALLPESAAPVADHPGPGPYRARAACRRSSI